MLETGLFMHTAFQADARGYRFREIWAEATGAPARGLALRAGFRLRCDSASDYLSHPPLPPPRQRPFLMGVTHAEAVAVDGCQMGRHFVYRPPRLNLTPCQQELLARYLRQPDLSDAAMATEINMSIYRVKNLLRAAYRHISDLSLGLLPEFGMASGARKRSGRCCSTWGITRRSCVLISVGRPRSRNS